MYCKYCGAELKNDAQFCSKCGNTMGGGTTSPTGMAKVIALILGFFCAIVPFFKTFEIPAVSWLMQFAGISGDGSFSFFGLLKIFYELTDGNMLEVIDELGAEEGGFIILLLVGVLIVIAILTIASYAGAVSLLTKNDSNSVQKGWRKMKGTAVGALGFEILQLIAYSILAYFSEGDSEYISFSDIISIKGIFYLELIIAITTIIISLHNYDSETLSQYREMKQMNHSNNEVKAQNTWVCNCGKRNGINALNCSACGKDNPNSSRVCKDCGYPKIT